MRQLQFTAGRAFCMAAAVFLSLAPLFHGFHLASCNHSHKFINAHDPANTIHPHHYSHSHPCTSLYPERYREEIDNLQSKDGHAHDPSACPICRNFFQLAKSQGISTLQAAATPKEVWFEKFHQKELFIYCLAFLTGYPRAPPLC